MINKRKYAKELSSKIGSVKNKEIHELKTCKYLFFYIKEDWWWVPRIGLTLPKVNQRPK